MSLTSGIRNRTTYTIIGTPVLFYDLGIGFCRADAACTVVVLLSNTWVRVIEQGAGISTIGCRGRSRGRAKQVWRDIDANSLTGNFGHQRAEILSGHWSACR